MTQNETKTGYLAPTIQVMKMSDRLPICSSPVTNGEDNEIYNFDNEEFLS